MTVGAVTLRLCPTSFSGLAEVIEDAARELAHQQAMPTLRPARSRLPS